MGYGHTTVCRSWLRRSGHGIPSQEEGRGRDASLTLAIGENLSRAAKDGDSMKKLVVLLVDVNSEIVGRDISTPDAVSQTVTFTGLLRGQYTLYIIANARGIWTCRQRHTRLEPRCPAR